MAQVIGIDLGGTAIKLGRFSEDGICHQSLTVPTPQPATPEAVLAAITDAILQLQTPPLRSGVELQTPPLRSGVELQTPPLRSGGLGGDQIRAIGIGTPGPADTTGRIARVAMNLKNWHNVPLADWLEAKTGLPTILANDADCAGLGESWLGAGKHFKNLILLTLGTGVGGAVILDGKLFTGHLGAAGELGLISINPDGPECNSGNHGSLEQYISVLSIRRDTGLEPLELANLAKSGDAKALEFWRNYGRYLGIGLASIIYILTPEAIIIGGGISAGAEFFLPTVRAEIERRVLPSSREGLQLLVAELGNQAGMVGAAKLAWQVALSND